MRAPTRLIPADWRMEMREAASPDVWTNFKRDILAEYPLRIKSGTQGGGPLDLVADGGQAIWSMNNSAANSARQIGLYSFDNPFCRPNWDVGLPVRWILGGEPKFYGQLRSAVPTDGPFSSLDVACVATDWMDAAARWPVHGLATMVNATPSSIFAAIVAGIPQQPVAIDADTINEVIPFAFDNVRTGETYGLAEIQKLCQSGFYRSHMLGDGTLRLEDRNARTSPRPDVVFSSRWPYQYSFAPRSYDVSGVATRVKVTVYPRRVDDEIKVLYTHREKTELRPGESRTFTCRYVDPAQLAARVGGRDMVTPLVATTDYAANKLADDSSTVMTASLLVAPVFGSDSAEVTVTNQHASEKMFVTHLQLRGYGMYSYDASTVEDVADAATILKYGDNPLSIVMPYQSSSTTAMAVAQGVRGTYGRRLPVGGSLRFCASRNEELMDLAVRLDISSCLAIEDTVNGNGVWYVNGLEYEIEPGDVLWVTCFLAYADPTDYFRVGLGQLGDMATPLKGF